MPVRDDIRQFEFLVLEGAQAGLSWSTILHRRDGYRRAFAGFDPRKVARITPKRVAALLTDPGIIRNRLKVEATVTNARAYLKVQEEFGTFSDYSGASSTASLCRTAGGSSARCRPAARCPTRSARTSRQRGFRFVGSTIIYAHLQATGLINDHLVSCFRHDVCKSMVAGQRAPRWPIRASA